MQENRQLADHDNGSPEPLRYHVERLDDVRERLAHLEGRMESLATKEDIANAKIAMMTLWVTLGLIFVMALVNAAIRFWPS